MIRIDIEEAGGGKYRFAEAGGRTEGISRIPLLDACRALKSLGEDPSKRIGLFRSGSDTPDLITTVGAGAELTVNDPPSGSNGAPKFGKWIPYSNDE